MEAALTIGDERSCRVPASVPVHVGCAPDVIAARVKQANSLETVLIEEHLIVV
jgi:hypothetical protein